MNQTPFPLAMIAALAENRVIGLDNQMPWHLPADLKHFKAMTLGKPIIMGRKTWDSLGRPLPGRLNLVVSRQPDLRLDGAEAFTSLDAALVRAEQWAREQGVDELMLIGGAQLYGQALSQAQRLYLTRIESDPEGDAFFPAFDEAEWQRTDCQAHPAQGEAPAYRFETWQRR
ncbi:dihydrofolate reductase [Pseudomonas sp. SST3]|uniref:dihydrofolate reductase n=1 Tax=Pseudomonas sp. SST3 TaxID=2267882 RepID=UPI000DFC8C7A|nr:dihydrofolate reductase [Pseudomonas sp. SST3]NKQ09577.1 dihydrofolate reductase [Pseudomonas sp. SST3]